MRVVAVVPMYPPKSRVGSVLTTHEFLRALAARGHDVVVVCRRGQHAGPTTFDAVTVHTGASKIEEFVPTGDVVLHHAVDAHRVAAVAGNRPRVVLEHGYGSDPAALDGTALAVFASQHLADTAGARPGDLVVPPPVRQDDYRTEPGDQVTLVGLSRAKGVDTMWKVADRMPDVSFLGVTGGYGEQRRPRCRNVEVMPTQVDMRKVYSRTRVLLMPSERETYGRVAVEASCSGIPVIAHPSAGVVEAIGDAGIYVDRTDIDGWVSALRGLLDNEDAWNEASERARAHADTLDADADLARVCDAIEALAPEYQTGGTLTAETAHTVPPVEQPKPPRYAVIGTGRSGSGYMAALLGCGHESWWNPKGARVDGLDGDASWLALPDIESGEWSGPVLHVTRHPVDVVRSLVGIGFFAGTDTRDPDGVFRQFAVDNCPEADLADPVEAAVEWWVRWNERCAAVASATVRIEDHDLSLRAADTLDVPVPDPSSVSPTTNSRKRSKTTAARIWKLLDGRAAQFGYEPDE